MFWHLLKSYCILSRTVESTEQMKSMKFCTNTISILRQHKVDAVIEIKQLELVHIDSLKADFEDTISEMLTDLNEDTVSGLLNRIHKSCETLLERVGSRGCSNKDLNARAVLTLTRKVVLLLDVAVVSYVKSHNFEFEGPNSRTLEVSEGEDWFAFSCSSIKLACLDAFIDGRKVWVFSFLDKDTDALDRPHRAAESGAYVLTKMQDLADIWGPVYTVPSTSGLIKYYGVSKGVICRTRNSSKCPVPGAIQCHYFSQISFFRRKASNLLSGGEQLLLAEDDLLLIGGGLRTNQDCKYTLSDFKYDHASDMSPLGTKESVWKPDTRSLAVGLCKYIGITVTGTQKLVPQTTLKQHILDKWTTLPSRANPGILNQYLGVEISHCTGNARRVALRQLMTSSSVMSVLERQTPGWLNKSWGKAFFAALRSDRDEKMFSVWKEWASNRVEMAELFCCVLELLDNTGRDQHNFHGALLHHNEEEAVSIKPSINDWSIALRDSHMTSAYVIINKICLNCEVPDHSASTCHLQSARTVLETQFVTRKSGDRYESGGHYKLQPGGDLLKGVLCGSLDTTVVEPTHSGPRTWLSGGKFQDFQELCNRTKSSTRNIVYIRASNTSFHGSDSPKEIRSAKSQIAETLIERQDRQKKSSSSPKPCATAPQAQKAKIPVKPLSNINRFSNR